MLKKKDKLLQILKNTESYSVLDYLTPGDLVSLALTKKSYYMQIMPLIRLRELDEEKMANKQKINNGPIKNKKQKNNKKQQKSSDSQSPQETGLKVEKFNINKWPKDLTWDTQKWQKIEKLPFINSFLQKKLDSKCYVFFKQKDNANIVYINRTMVDPNLDFEKGSFNDQIAEDIYQHMYEQSEIELDFSSRQMLLRRQKEMLEKINLKKAQKQEKNIISCEKEFQRAFHMKRYAIILCFGGSFSLGVYEKSKCIIHQSDKKYVCRKKAGQRQFNKDKQSGSSIKSMGSQIRRDQQKKHLINVNFILNQNKDELFKCQVIFLQAPGMNRLYIINQNQTMAQLQKKLRSVCLTAKKANFTEVSLINDAINTVHWVKIDQEKRQKK